MKKRKAFTLIELTIAAALGIMLLGVTALSLSTFLRSWNAFAGRIEPLEASRFSAWKITTEIRNCEYLSPGSNAERLVLSLDGKEIAYDHCNGKLRRSVDGHSTYLTEKGRVSAIRFSYPLPGLVRFEIALGGGVAERTIAAEAAVRNPGL